MPQEVKSPIYEDWWLSREFRDADLQAKSERLRRRREAAEALRAKAAELGLTEEDLQAMFAGDAPQA